MIDSVEKTTIRKIYVRLLPLLFAAYFICYLDRINVGFAALTMNKDLGFTASVGGHRVLLGLLPVRGAEQHHS